MPTTSPSAFVYAWYCDHRGLLSFPTRRSSDLQGAVLASGVAAVALGLGGEHRLDLLARSEEHTSELQSRPQLVCRLLLEKKKTSFAAAPPVWFDPATTAPKRNSPVHDSGRSS